MPRPSSWRAKRRSTPTRKAPALSVAIESGPAFHFGDIEVRGLDRYTPELVKSFSTIKPGDLYGERPLDEFIRRLLASGYFASVQASIVPDPEHAEAATLTMAVIEAPPKRLEVGLGYSTDTQWKASGNYSDVNIDGHGLQFYADARVETKLSSGSVRFVLPPAPGGWLDAFAVGLERTDIENLVTRTAGVSWRRRSIDETSTPAFGAGYYQDQQQPHGQPDGGFARAVRRRRVHVAARRQPALAGARLHGQRAGRRRRARRVDAHASGA